jgi:hypothetical protein
LSQFQIEKPQKRFGIRFDRFGLVSIAMHRGNTLQVTCRISEK